MRGDTTDRAGPVARFQQGKVPLFLISLKAGGTGLNLTAADTVIHYDPWWNPAVEDQATDRAHRIGQDKPVFVYKLVAQGTVEERMLELQQRKKALAAGIYEAGRQCRRRTRCRRYRAPVPAVGVRSSPGAKLHRRETEEAFSRLEKGEQGGALTRLADDPPLFSAVRR